ncbi:MAG TPA: hypothetical protein VJS37_15880 [Terriglobales bacterium]|nr:hypothetical protein [Terriglobales bacterium]
MPADIRNPWALYAEGESQQHANRHGECNAECGVDEARLAYVQHFAKIHPETEQDNGSLKQEL